MKSALTKDLCVCVLAYNEERNIARTLDAIRKHDSDLEFDIIVYANGCSDNTAAVVREYGERTKNVHLRELDIASKVNAWNTAYAENTHDILVFCDGDVIPAEGAVPALYRQLKINAEVALCCCESMPLYRQQPLGNRLIGFIQIPVCQDFLIGHCYAFKRPVITEQLRQRGLQAIPPGIVAEDAFVETLFPADSFRVIETSVYYDPPNYPDYIRYLARIRWQNEQLALFDNHDESGLSLLQRLRNKLTRTRSVGRFLLGALTHSLKALFLVINRRKIEQAYHRLGPVKKDGVSILSSATRSQSVK